MGSLRSDYRKIMANRHGGSSLATAYWERVGAALFERSGGMCEICPNAFAAHIHHLHYRHLCDELRHTESLVHCCVDCHVVLDRYRVAFGTRKDVTYDEFLAAMES